MFSFFLLIISCFGAYSESKTDFPPYQNPKFPLAKRVSDLISRMTLSEKFFQLGSPAPAIDRLGVAAYNYWNEALHGVVSSGATSFPQAIALSSTWDRDLIYRVAVAISDEARVKNNHDGKGLVYWSPTINMSRDPRWGRTEETYGEDPFLTAQIAEQFIRGMQGSDARYLKTVATVKHFACNNVELNRNRISSNVDERSLREYYLPAFKACITEAGVYSVMSAYNALNEVPCPVNRTLLTNILRDEWGFTGFVVSDCNAVFDVYASHGYVQTAPDATALSIKSGTDLNCGGTYQYFASPALSLGLMSEADIDTALTRIFKARFLLGEFDPPALVPYTSIPDSILDCPNHRNLAILAAKEAIVLLKNQNGILPLNKDSISSIAVIGPNASVVQLGGYSGTPSVLISTLQGIMNKFNGSGMIINFAEGCSLYGDKDSAAFEYAVNLAKNSDVAIVVGGTDLRISSEEKDRISLDLPGVQDSLVQEVFRVNKRTIVVLISGFPLSINQINDSIPGIISALYGGQAQDAAIADVLFGDYNPGGKLTSTWYKSVADLPEMDRYDINENRTYQYFKGAPLFPFGYGLSYTTFEYSNLIKSAGIVKPGDLLMVSVTIKNIGKISGDETPQFYIHHVSSGIKRPLKELQDFQRISLQPGESKTVTFRLKHEDLAYYNEKSKSFVVEDGVVEIMAGSSSEDIKLIDEIQVQGTTVANTFRQNALGRIEAENFEKKSKPLSIVANNEGGQSISVANENDYTVYRNVDFGTGVTQFNASIELDSTIGQDGTLEIRLDSITGSLAGLMMLVAPKKGEGYQKKSCMINGATGKRDLFLLFKNSGNGFCKMNWFGFQNGLFISDKLKCSVQLYPNPSSSQFRLAFNCSVNSEILIEIFTIEGIRIKSFRPKAQFTGINRISFNTEDLGLKRGLYLVNFAIDNYRETFKLCVVPN